MSVPLFATSLEPYHDRMSEAIGRVARSGRYILGPEVEAFEREFASYVGVRHCVGVANGTDALTIALRALGVRPGAPVRQRGPGGGALRVRSTGPRGRGPGRRGGARRSPGGRARRRRHVLFLPGEEPPVP